MRRHLESQRQAVGRRLGLAPIGFLLVALGTGAASGQTPSPTGPWQSYGTDNGEWRSYAGNTAGQKYSPLDQIDAGNFNQLEIAWEWTSVDRTLSRTTAAGGEWYAPLDTIVESLVADTPDFYREGQSPNPSRFQATPLMIDGVLYFNTPLSQGVALDATTGETLWVILPNNDLLKIPVFTWLFQSRGRVVHQVSTGRCTARCF